MLSYLHGYHAGNAADVLKHSALVFCLEYLKRKAKPLLCVDTHAGAGLYDFSDTSNRNGEWEKGVGKLLAAFGAFQGRDLSPQSVSDRLPPMIAGYLKTAVDFRDSHVRYSGSPAIMAKLLTDGDRLVSYELHPGEFETLNASMAELRRGSRGAGRATLEVRKEDGTEGLKSLLPPPSRRALVFIDPSWEDKNEFETIPAFAAEGLRRFPEGTFIVWYPLLASPKKKDAPVSVQDMLFNLKETKCCLAELCTGKAETSPRGMYGSGIVIYNPPWTLKSAFEEALPFLAKFLGGGKGDWRLKWRG